MEMASDSASWNDITCLFCRIFNLSNSILMEWIQSLLVFLAALTAVAYLFSKWKPKSKNKKGDSCGPDCGCH